MGSVSSPRSPHGPDDTADAAMALRRLLEAVESGEIDADNPRARRLLRRLEGAVGECDWGAEKAQGPIDLEPGVRDCCLPMNGTYATVDKCRH
jgi:hypothetical protein